MADKTTNSADTSIDSILHEDRRFECPPHFAEKAHVKTLEEYELLYKESVEEPEKFWGRIANELHWFKKWDRVLEWNAPWAKWFVGGEINLSYNCLDRHVKTWRKNKAALIWESEPGEVRTLHIPAALQGSAEVCQRSEVTGREERRPSRNLHGHDAGTADCDAGVRAHRRTAFGRVRRICFATHWSTASTTRRPSPSSRRMGLTAAAPR